MMSNILVIGHLNPDTDSIAAAISLTHLLQTQGKEAQARKKGNLNKESAWALEYSQNEGRIRNIAEEEITPESKIFLVDFNEESQSPIDPTRINLTGLIDHHKIAGNWKTEEPILFRIEPIGSSSTLVAKMFQEKRLEIPLNIAKLLLCGIISDTLNLTSPTTTEEDIRWVKILSSQTGEDTAKMADALFEAKSDLSTFSPAEIAKLDYKNFDFGGKKVGIGVIETVKPDKVRPLENALKDELKKIKVAEVLDFAFLGIVDIIKNQTELLIIGGLEKELALKAFPNAIQAGDNMLLEGVVSRKKQIAPEIERAIKN